MKTKLRFGILIDGDVVPAWAQPILDDLATADFLTQVCLVKLEASQSRAFSSVTIVQNGTGRALDLVGSCAVSEAADSLKSFELDVVLSLCHHTPTDDFANVAKYGWWRFRFGTTYDATAIGISEIFSMKRKQVVALERVGFGLIPSVDLKSGVFKVLSFSISRHQRATLSQCASWPTAIMRQLAAGQEESMVLSPSPSPIMMRTPSLFEKRVARVLSFFNRVKYEFDRVKRQFVYQSWNVGLVELPESEFFDREHQGQVKWWPRRTDGSSVADPFPIYVDGQLYVMAETFNHVDHVGTISAFLTNERGEIVEQQEAIKFPCHLSYPCLVQHENRIYATFEALETNELAIYQCDRFPNVWTRLKVVVARGKFADPTLFQHEGRWWIFATQYDPYSEGNSLLNAWYSDDGLSGQWFPHLMNPIKCDVESSRSAGTPFVRDGKLFRPSQNCGGSYGQSVVIGEIERLTPLEFIENRSREIRGRGQYPDGLHHMSRAGNWRTIDGRRDVVSLSLGFRKIWFKLQQLKAPVRFKSLSQERKTRWSSTPPLVPQLHSVTGQSDDQ